MLDCTVASLSENARFCENKVHIRSKIESVNIYTKHQQEHLDFVLTLPPTSTVIVCVLLLISFPFSSDAFTSLGATIL